MLIGSKTRPIRAYSVKALSCPSSVLSSKIIDTISATLCWLIILTSIIIIGIRSAVAEVEEVSAPTQFALEYNNSPFPFDFIVTLLINTYDSTVTPPRGDGEIQEYIANNTNKRNAVTSRHNKSGVSENLKIFRGVFVPDAVWSFDASTGAHFEHNSGELGSEFATVPEGVQKTPDFWTKPSLSLWVEDSDGRVEKIIAPSPTIIQVASCGGDSAEHNDLDYCNIGENAVIESNDKYTELQNTANATIPQQNTNTISLIVSSTSSTSTQEIQETPTTSALVNNIVQQNNLIDLSALSNQCVDTSACATTQTAPTDSPPAPIDSPPAPADSPPAPPDSPTPLTPLTPVISFGDPGPVPEPPIPSTPPLAASPVPETSTWIMMIIGFGIMIVACRRRAPNPIKRGTVGPVHTSPNGQWRC